MKIRFIKPSFEIDMLGQTGIEKLKHIEKVARTCYKSEDKITEDSYIKMVSGLVKRGHTAMLEHASFAVKFIASRAFSHELVRHRIASFAQESQRYVGYGNVIEFIIPPWMDLVPFECDLEHYKDIGFANHSTCMWFESMCLSAWYYNNLLTSGWKPEEARDVLPNAAKTEIWIEGNLRTWMNVQDLRDHHTASPQMRELMEPLFVKIGGMIPGVFNGKYITPN